MLQGLLGLYTLCVGGLIAAELGSSQKWQVLLKPLAAFGFVSLALAAGAMNTPYGQIILLGLLLCAAGDICLLSRDNPNLFKGGMAAFAAGHMAYCAAFLKFNLVPNFWACIGIFVIGVLVYMYLYRKLEADMRMPVLIYTVIILAMVILAMGTGHTVLMLAASLFALSDICVARDRFIGRNPKHALIISPFYFGAQGLFALSPGII